MSQQGPIIVVSAGEPPPFASALHDAELLPVVPCRWAAASRSLAQLTPAAVVVAASAAGEIGLEALARQVAATRLYLPLIVVDPTTSLPDNAIPCTQSGGKFDRLIARLRSALRGRKLHLTVMRRVDGGAAPHATFDDADPARDPTVLLIGRGAAYPSLSVSLGERMGVVGALPVEAAGPKLSTRHNHGNALGGGFLSRARGAILP